MRIEEKAPAKINIFLDIVGKLDNGYHSLFMVMQTVGLFDTISIESREDKEIILTCNKQGIPLNEKNTCYKAAQKFLEYTNIKAGVSININKSIPHEAGLAGGSSDAASVIKGLNKMFSAGLSEAQMCEIGLMVGSDVPFCIVGGTCLCQNTGGVISKLKPLKQCYIVLAKPQKGVSTVKAYEDADNTYLYHPDCVRMLDACEKADFDGICKYAGNVFEQVVEVPERVEIKEIMRNNNCSLAQMSGSGPTVFGLFLSESDAIKAYEEIKKICPEVYISQNI